MIICGDDEGIGKYEFEEIRASLAVERAIREYCDEYGHPTTSIQIHCVS